MKLRYLVILVMVLLLIGCAKKPVEPAEETPTETPQVEIQPETTPAVETPAEEAEEAVPEPVVEEVKVTKEEATGVAATIEGDYSEQFDIEVAVGALSEDDQETYYRLKAACDRGNAGLCAALERFEEKHWPSIEE